MRRIAAGEGFEETDSFLEQLEASNAPISTPSAKESVRSLEEFEFSPRQAVINAMPRGRRRFLIELFDSSSFLLLVLMLVSAHAYLLLHEAESTEFETFCSLFFALEVITRIYAHRPSGFFRGYSKSFYDFDRWANLADFTLSALDVFSLLLMYHLIPAFLPSDIDTHENARVGGHMAGLGGHMAKGAGRLSRFSRVAAKSGRFVESMIRLVRLVRVWRILKGFRPLAKLLQACFERFQLQAQGQRQWSLSCLYDCCDLFDMDKESLRTAKQKRMVREV